jgi:hypothetical protein
MDYLMLGNFVIDRAEQPAGQAARRVAPQTD